MSQWTGDVQSRIDAGESLIIWPAAHIEARQYSDGQIVPLGLSRGSEAIAVSIDGVGRTYHPAGDALEIEGLQVTAGLTIQGQRIRVLGINQTIEDLQRSYNLNNAPLDIHDLAFTPGMQLLGTRRLFRGFVDGATLTHNNAAGDFTLVAVSALRRGTRTLDAMLDENRDPIFKYVASTTGDKWG